MGLSIPSQAGVWRSSMWSRRLLAMTCLMSVRATAVNPTLCSSSFRVSIASVHCTVLHYIIITSCVSPTGPLPVPSDLSLVFRDGTLCVDWRGPLPPNATFQVEFSEDPPTLTNTTANSLHKTLLPRPLNISVRVRVATALATGNWSASQSLHLPGEPATPTAGPDDSTMSIVTATIIGTLGFAVLNLLLTCALLYCYYQKDRGEISPNRMHTRL